jgi:hypothetical protein
VVQVGVPRWMVCGCLWYPLVNSLPWKIIKSTHF